MRKYLFGTGLITTIVGAISLLRGLRSDDPFTWRTALGWLSWGITVALTIGAVVDTRRAAHGEPVPADSPVAPKAEKLRKKQLRK